MNLTIQTELLPRHGRVAGSALRMAGLTDSRSARKLGVKRLQPRHSLTDSKGQSLISRTPPKLILSDDHRGTCHSIIGKHRLNINGTRHLFDFRTLEAGVKPKPSNVCWIAPPLRQLSRKYGSSAFFLMLRNRQGKRASHKRQQISLGPQHSYHLGICMPLGQPCRDLAGYIRSVSNRPSNFNQISGPRGWQLAELNFIQSSCYRRPVVRPTKADVVRHLLKFLLRGGETGRQNPNFIKRLIHQMAKREQALLPSTLVVHSLMRDWQQARSNQGEDRADCLHPSCTRGASIHRKHNQPNSSEDENRPWQSDMPFEKLNNLIAKHSRSVHSQGSRSLPASRLHPGPERYLNRDNTLSEIDCQWRRGQP